MDGLFTNKAAKKPSHKSVEWYTPKWVFDELSINFDLDPSSPHDFKSLVPAKKKYTIFDDGLSKEWFGRVWLNPPYGRETKLWVNRLIDHGNGIALLFSRTDANWCQASMRACSAMLFISGRIEFVPGLENQHKKSRCGAGSVMFAFGEENAIALRRMAHRGLFIENKAALVTSTNN